MRVKFYSVKIYYKYVPMRCKLLHMWTSFFLFNHNVSNKSTIFFSVFSGDVDKCRVAKENHIIFVTSSRTGLYWPQSSQDRHRHRHGQVKLSGIVLWFTPFYTALSVCLIWKIRQTNVLRSGFAFVKFIKQAVQRIQRKKTAVMTNWLKNKAVVKKQCYSKLMSLTYWSLDNFKTLSSGRSSWFSIIVSTAVVVNCRKSWRMIWSAVVEPAAVDTQVKTASWQYYF